MVAPTDKKINLFLCYEESDEDLFKISKLIQLLKEKAPFIARIYDWNHDDEKATSISFTDYWQNGIRSSDLIIFFCNFTTSNSKRILEQISFAKQYNKITIPIFSKIQDIPSVLKADRGLLYDTRTPTAFITILLEHLTNKNNIDTARIKHTVFISYDTRDLYKFKIPNIVSLLEAQTEHIAKVFYWNRDTQPGQQFTDYMEKSISIADVILFFCSENSLNSQPVSEEINLALSQRKRAIAIYENSIHKPSLLEIEKEFTYLNRDISNLVIQIFRQITGCEPKTINEGDIERPPAHIENLFLLESLFDSLFHTIGNDLSAFILVDLRGAIIASRTRDSFKEEKLDGLPQLVEPILRRISEEQRGGNFGTGTFDTDDNRLMFMKAGKDTVLIMVFDILASFDRIQPYAYLCGEKIARLIDERPVSPIIPNMRPSISINPSSISKPRIADENLTLKTIIVGDKGVGKTAIISRFVTGLNDGDSDYYKPTIGISIQKKGIQVPTMNGQVTFALFDLAGQTPFQRVRNTYYHEAKVGFLVYDITRYDTFTNIKKWYDDINATVSDVLLKLIANKSDLNAERKVSIEQGKLLAQELGVCYVEISALNFNDVNTLFQDIAEEYVQNKK